MVGIGFSGVGVNVGTGVSVGTGVEVGSPGFGVFVGVAVGGTFGGVTWPASTMPVPSPGSLLGSTVATGVGVPKSFGNAGSLPVGIERSVASPGKTPFGVLVAVAVGSALSCATTSISHVATADSPSESVRRAVVP